MLLLVLAIAVSGTAMGGDVQPPVTTTAAVAAPASPAVLRQTKRRIHLYVKSTRRWQALMGLRASKVSRLASTTKSIAYARWSLKKWKSLSGRLHARARRWMAKRTEFFLADAARLRENLGMSPVRSLAAVRGVESRFNSARRLDSRLAQKWRSSWLYAAMMCIHSGMKGGVRVGSGEGGFTSVSRTNPPYYGGWQMDMTFQRQYGAEFLRRWGTADHWPAWAQLQAAVRAYHSGRGFGPWPKTRLDCGL